MDPISPQGNELAPYLGELLRLERLYFPNPWGALQLQEEADLGALRLVGTPGQVLAYCCARHRG